MALSSAACKRLKTAIDPNKAHPNSNSLAKPTLAIPPQVIICVKFT